MQPSESENRETIPSLLQMIWNGPRYVPEYFTPTGKPRFKAFSISSFTESCHARLSSNKYESASRTFVPFARTQNVITHFYFACDKVQVFWRSICAWFEAADDLYLSQLSAKEFIFGIPKDSHKSRVINNILVLIRFYIHRQKLFHSCKLELLPWLCEFRQRLKIEEWICRKKQPK